MKRIILTTILTASSTVVAYADPGHIEAAGHGHSHWMAYGIIAGIAAVAAGIWIARVATKTMRAQS